MSHAGRLSGKVAIVTGAARGQGEADARLFAAEGARVVLTDVLTDAGAAVARDIGDHALFVQHDVADEAGWTTVVERALEWAGRIDVLVNNAGALKRSGLLETSREDFELHFRVMELGAFLGMRAVARPMAATGGGSIINVSSTTAVTGSRDAIAYTATKWAIRGLTRCAAIELAPLGIRVNTLIPGYIDTDMSRSNTPEHNAAYLARIPLARVGGVDEVAQTVLHLASDESAYVTGAEFKVDGGLTI